MNYIESLTNDFFKNMNTCDFSNMNFAQICGKKGIVCFESTFSPDIYGYVLSENGKVHIRINNNIPSNQKEISIASLLSIYLLNINKNNEKYYLNSSNFKTFNNYYKLGLNLLFAKKIKDKILSQESISSIRNMDSNYFKLNKINEIANKTNISLPHVFNFFN